MPTAHDEMRLMRGKHPDWIWNRSDTHVFLGEPGSLDAFKVPVEPGNSFSPGVGSFGISTWVYDHKGRQLWAPELMASSDMTWSFLYGHIPVLLSAWMADGILGESRLFVTGDNAAGDHRVYMRIRLMNARPEVARLDLLTAVRSFGAAGGPIISLGVEDGGDGRVVFVNGSPGVICETPPTRLSTLSYAETGMDISVLARAGELPAANTASDPSGWASGTIVHEMTLDPGSVASFDFMLPVHRGHPLLSWLPYIAKALPGVDYDGREAQHIDTWQAIFDGVTLRVPDARFSDAFYSQVAHEYMVTVHDAVRICPISYPMWWLRDGVYLLAALGKAGLDGFVGSACEAIAPVDAFGGMGAEGDGPGESLWALTEHYLLTRDRSYLESVYPHLVRKADLIVRMRHTAEPMRHLAEFRTTAGLLSPAADILCGPAESGLINGRMDWHYPVYWVNGFAHAGLLRAAGCAREMGDIARAEGWEEEARQLRAALQARIPRDFGANERDLTGSIWPSKGMRPDDAGVREAFDSFWDGKRCPGGEHRPERLWTYFELGQAHNYLYLGQRERTWLSLDYFLSHHAAQGLYTWSEGDGDENSSGLWQQVRGWDAIPFVTPHGWTSAEMLLLLRDVLIYEWEDGDGLEVLVLGGGVPESWVRGYPFVGIAGAPTHCGRTSWLLEGFVLTVDCERPPDGGYVIAFPGGRDVSPVSDGICCARQADGSTRVTVLPGCGRPLPPHVELRVRLEADPR